MAETVDHADHRGVHFGLISYYELVFFMGEKKEQIRRLYSQIPFEANRSPDSMAAQPIHQISPNPSQTEHQPITKPVDIKPSSKNDLKLDKSKDKDKIENVDSIKAKLDDQPKSMSDLDIFKTRLDSVADFLNVPQFKKFRIPARIGGIDFSSVAHRFKYI